MPLYEYRCIDNGHHFEKIQVFGAPAPACPVCGGPVERLVSAPAIQFKGSGFYITDYAASNSRPASDSSSDGGSKPAGDTASKPAADSKPAESAAPAAASTTSSSSSAKKE